MFAAQSVHSTAQDCVEGTGGNGSHSQHAASHHLPRGVERLWPCRLHVGYECCCTCVLCCDIDSIWHGFAAETARNAARASAIAAGVKPGEYVEDPAVTEGAMELHNKSLRLFGKMPLTVLNSITSGYLANKQIPVEVGSRYFELSMKVSWCSCRCVACLV